MSSIPLLKPVSLMEALMEAQELGYTLIRPSETGITVELTQFAEELLETHVDYKDYVRFGCFIIRLADAWKEDAEIYELS